MYLKWTTVCYTCDAPLNPRCMARGYVNKSFIRAYRHIRPIFLGNNATYYAFVGLKVQRVCYACFKHKVRLGPKMLRDREIGHHRFHHPYPRAKTTTEIVQWFDGLLRRALINRLNITYTPSTTQG